jgi:hypothetical protein
VPPVGVFSHSKFLLQSAWPRLFRGFLVNTRIFENFLKAKLKNTS